MSRPILLLIFALWLIASATPLPRQVWPVSAGLPVLMAGYLALVLAARFWARWIARSVDVAQIHRKLGQFNRGLTVAQALVPTWFAFTLFGPVGWAGLVRQVVGPISLLDITTGAGEMQAPLALPGLLLGTLPALSAWVGLWWARFPADQALREQNLMNEVDQGLPIHPPPTLRQYLSSNFRLQVLFILLPILLILLLHDLVLTGVWLAKVPIGRLTDLENWILLPSAALIYVFAPELLRRVLHTRPLEASPLRTRLEEICRRRGLKYREILLWDTQGTMGNAAVMGIVPRLRYILLSDLLLESMPDREIEAVFAHEVGHIVHRHMSWYIVFFGVLMLAAMGIGPVIDRGLQRFLGDTFIGEHAPALVALAGFCVWIFVIFGYLSRRFERQADVFAARMLESNWGLGRPQPALIGAPAAAALEGSPPAVQILDYARPDSYVGEYGAGVFASALRRVAVINNIPIAARSWCHGSIQKRMRYLLEISGDPARTSEFDRLMIRLYVTLLLALGVCAALVYIMP